MKYLEKISLKNYSTMRLGGNARYLCEVHSEDDLLQALDFAQKKSLMIKVIGEGSNIIWSEHGYDGLVIVNKILKFDINGTEVTIGAGVEWDSAVAQTVDEGLSGIELLSLIPGTTGATPVQNVGAYGREISDVLVSLRAFDAKIGDFVEISNAECAFGYRSSRFNQADAGRFIITSITLGLSEKNPSPPFYESLQRFFDVNKVPEYTPKVVRDAVVAVRTAKLPDPDVIANNGSFFSNPVVDFEKFELLKIKFPEIVGWTAKDGIKISAAWIIEKAGLKDFHDPDTGMATWAAQPLVLINESAKTTDDLIKFRNKIIETIQEKFEITLKQEPELVN